MNTITRSGSTTFDRISAFFAGVADKGRRYGVYRQTLRELDALSDRDLNDLGLHRAMIEDVALQAAYGK